MLMTFAHIFFLLFIFMRIFVDAGLGIEVLNSDVEDGVLAADEEAMNCKSPRLAVATAGLAH